MPHRTRPGSPTPEHGPLRPVLAQTVVENRRGGIGMPRTAICGASRVPKIGDCGAASASGPLHRRSPQRAIRRGWGRHDDRNAAWPGRWACDTGAGTAQLIDRSCAWSLGIRQGQPKGEAFAPPFGSCSCLPSVRGRGHTLWLEGSHTCREVLSLSATGGLLSLWADTTEGTPAASYASNTPMSSGPRNAYAAPPRPTSTRGRTTTRCGLSLLPPSATSRIFVTANSRRCRSSRASE